MTSLMLSSFILLTLPTGIPNEDQADQVTLARLSSEIDSFFRKITGTAVEYLHLEKGGGYSRIHRTDLGTEEVLETGTWKQGDNEEAVLISKTRYRDIVVEPLKLFVGREDRLGVLSTVRERLLRVLDESQEHRLARKRLEGIKAPSDQFSAVVVSGTCGQVARTTVEALIREIDAFLASDEKNHFHFTPMKYRDVNFLVWMDSETSLNRSPREIKERIDESYPQRPLSIWIQIDEATFDRNTSRISQLISSFFDFLSGQR
ncbi:MAG: hypothetical protein HUU16_08370 [Candidatus Omnitrophica bacterium]|nr:hypothetical protein [bacterium]NUN96177.1 hypothetical protein [Candidatus Omnitrophota bacterium]